MAYISFVGGYANGVVDFCQLAKFLQAAVFLFMQGLMLIARKLCDEGGDLGVVVEG